MSLRGFISFGRALVAGCVGGVVLYAGGARRPTGREWRALGLVALGVVIGFSTLTSIALQWTSASHGAGVIAILPAATAAAGVLSARESPSRSFWLAAAAGGTLVTAYSISRAGGALRLGDVLLVAGVAVCAFGYAEGAVVARTLGVPQTICWALILSLPLTVPLAAMPGRAPGADAISGFLYVGLGSMLLGFFAWYGGLSRAGVARTSQGPARANAAHADVERACARRADRPEHSRGGGGGTDERGCNAAGTRGVTAKAAVSLTLHSVTCFSVVIHLRSARS